MKGKAWKILLITMGIVIGVGLAVGSALAWDRSWEFANPTFNPNSMAGNYLQFTAEVSNQAANEMPDMGDIMEDAFNNVENLFIDIQEGIGNVGIDLPPEPTTPSDETQSQ